MVKYLLIILLGILPFNINAQTSFVTTTASKQIGTTPNTVDNAPISYYDYAALVTVNDKETIITLTNDNAKSTYYVETRQVASDANAYFYFTVSEYGGNVSFIFDLDKGEIEIMWKSISNGKEEITKLILNIKKVF